MVPTLHFFPIRWLFPCCTRFSARPFASLRPAETAGAQPAALPAGIHRTPAPVLSSCGPWILTQGLSFCHRRFGRERPFHQPHNLFLKPNYRARGPVGTRCCGRGGSGAPAPGCRRRLGGGGRGSGRIRTARNSTE